MFVSFIYRSLQFFPTFFQPFGSANPRNHSEAFKVGSRLTFAAFTSLSLADSTAESFGDRILFQVGSEFWKDGNEID